MDMDLSGNEGEEAGGVKFISSGRNRIFTDCVCYLCELLNNENISLANVSYSK
jgi:hypothetical protein